MLQQMYRYSLWVGAFLLLQSGVAYGQRLSEGQVEIEKKCRATTSMRKDLFLGYIGAEKTNKEHLLAIKQESMLVVFPLQWVSEDRSFGGTFRRGTLNKVLEEFEDYKLNRLSRLKAKTASVQPLFYHEVADRVVELMEFRESKFQPIVGVNACRMLALITEHRKDDKGMPLPEKEWIEEVTTRMAEGTGEHFAQTCLKLLAMDNCNDGMRYYLYRCIGGLLEIPPQTPPLLKPETREKLIEVLVKQIEKKVAYPKATPQVEINGYRILRLQAIKALANAKTPATTKDKPALWLARVAGKDKEIVPSPRMEERVEAAIGLCRLAPGSQANTDLNMDLIAHQVGWAVQDFGDQANKNLDSKTVERVHPWKVDASRLIEALDQLKTVKTPEVQNLAKKCQDVVVPIEQGRSGPSNVLMDWLDQNPPKSSTIFKSDNRSLITRDAIKPKGK